MCTAIAHKGDDIIYGFNLDIDPEAWKYSIYKTKSVFAIGITVGKTTHLVHGVNKCGNFSNVPYMNGEIFPVPHGARRERIDLLSERYIRGKYSFCDIEEILRTKAITCIPQATMHSLVGNGSGDALIIEPGYESRKVEENFAVLTNFPVFAGLSDFSCAFYGKERYDRAVSALSCAGADFSAEDALRLLYETRQEGRWATRVTFVYSKNKNAVFYYLDGDISHIKTHTFT